MINMPVHVICLVSMCVDWHNYVNADQNTVTLPSDRNIHTSEPYGNKLSSPSQSGEKIVDEKYDQISKTDVLESDDDEDEYPDLVELYMDYYGKGDFVKFHETKISENENISMDKIYSNITLPPGVHRFLVKNVSCTVYNIHHLNCSWAMENVPEGAHYSLTVHQDDFLLPCDCSFSNEAGVVKCNGKKIDDESYLTININVTVTNFQYVHSQKFEPVEIEKLNSPHNITASVISGNLYIEWDLKSKVRNIKCFNFQLRIKSHSEEFKEVWGRRNLTIPNIDQTQTYKIQIRVTKSDRCRKNGIWSDWSETVVVNPYIKADELNVLMICAISLGIPMVLLALLLLCRQPRMLDKLFPPVPSPSVKIQQLLEKDDIIQVMQFRYLEEIAKVEDDD